MNTAKTYFEQVSLETIKQIVKLKGEGPATRSNRIELVQGAAKVEMPDHDRQDLQYQDLQYPVWQKLCREALIELDKDKLKERVAAAEAAVFLRLQELAHNPEGYAERQALRDVTSSLRFLKRDVLKFPDWGSETKD